MSTTPLIPFAAREKVARLVEIQRTFDAGRGDPVSLYVEHAQLYRDLKELGLTELQIETAIWRLANPD